jgi:hypothetical protein
MPPAIYIYIRYLGDATEGFHLHVLKNKGGRLQVASETVLEGDQMIFEGLAPMWTDIDGDGVEDILTTASIDNLTLP